MRRKTERSAKAYRYVNKKSDKIEGKGRTNRW